MPFIDKQVEILNASLVSGLFGHKRFGGGVVHGLANIINEAATDTDDAKSFPVVYNENEEPKPVGVDDTYTLIVYHRATGQSFDTPDTSFGDGFGEVKQTTSMVMVVYGSRTRLKLSPETLAGLIILAMPNFYGKTELIGSHLDTLFVEVTGSDLEPLSVFGAEFNGVDFSISPDEFMFKIEYSLKCEYRKTCLNICDCLNEMR
jgi:hypothetical protein